MSKHILLATATLVAAVSSAAPKILYTDEPTAGVTALPVELNEYRSPPMYARASVPTPEQTKVMGEDFFQAEFGQPFSCSFTNGFSRLFGTQGRNPKEHSIRFGRGWGKCLGGAYEIWMEGEQSVPETKWEFVLWENKYRHPVAFDVKADKDGKINLRQRLGDVRNLVAYTGLELVCHTTNAAVSVRSAKIVPVCVPMTWRAEFALGEKPWCAGMTLGRRVRHTARVNGTVVSEGLGIDGQEPFRGDIANLLKAGTNVIEVATEYVSGYNARGELAIEVGFVSATGETKILQPDVWRVRYDVGGDWFQPSFSRNPKMRMGYANLGNDLPVASGDQPFHTGALQVRHTGPEYPVFDYDDKEIVYAVSLPPQLGEAQVSCVVSNVLTGGVAERRQVKVGGEGEERREKSTLDFSFAGLKTGVYKMHWTLTRGTNVIDRVRTDLAVAGPIDQTFCAFKDFDRVLAQRMKQVQEVDCTRNVTDPKVYAENPCHPAWPNVDHKTHVTTEKGLAFRETGLSSGDWFGYKLDVTKLGMAHILEVDYPDTRNQMLYVAIEEGYPIGFMNNPPRGGAAFANASGAVRTGWMTPLTGGRKTLRILFYPGSKNIAVTFENGGIGRAAVCGFRLYEVPEGVPALELPPTDRYYGNHCERPIFQQWGAHVHGSCHHSWSLPPEMAYAASFAGIANRIRFLRYMGQNLAVEGVYMYKQGFPTLSGESFTGSPSFDYCYLMAKMYKHNGIRLLGCFEYLAAPAIELGGGYDIGDREMLASKVPCTPSHGVSRYGKQSMGFGGSGLNYLAPHVWGSITNVLTEIYRRYEPTGAFAGLYVINNGWWIPGIPTANGDKLKPTEVGFDDLSVELFQKETGIDLGIPYTPERFAKRYELLTGRHNAVWTAWRAKKLRDSMTALRDICRTGANKWELFSSPCLAPKKEEDAFRLVTSTPAERDAQYGNVLRDHGFPPEIWGDLTDGARLVPTISLDKEQSLATLGLFTSEGTRKVVEDLDVVYMQPAGLNERWISTDSLSNWWWRASGSRVFEVKPSDTGAFFDMVGVCSACTPSMMVHTWLDVNLPTAHGRESRRFALGYAATPKGRGVPFPNVKGVQAKLFPDGGVQLVNNTPYPLVGTLKASRFGFPLAIDETFNGKARGKMSFRLEPYAITVVRTRWAAKSLTGTFRFEDSGLVEKSLADAALILQNERLCSHIKPSVLAALKRAFAGKDGYGLVTSLGDFEVRRVAEKFLDVARRPAMKMEEMKEYSRYDKPEPLTFKPLEPGQGFAPFDRKNRKEMRAYTFSTLVKGGTKGTDLYFHLDPFRHDFDVRDGRLTLIFLAFRVKPGQRGWLDMNKMSGPNALSPNEWHHVCYTVDADGLATQWVDGDLVDAIDLVDHHGVKLPPRTGEVSAARSAKVEGLDHAGVSFARESFREGVMRWQDIQKEADEWRAAANDRK